MKKFLATITLLTILLSLAACGGSAGSPSSREIIPSHFTGLWTIDVNSEPVYYLILGEQIYIATQENIMNAFAEILNDTLLNQSLSAWKSMEFQDALTELEPDDICPAVSQIRNDSGTGDVVLLEGTSEEKRISLTAENTVVVTSAADGSSYTMSKLADGTDFSDSQFELLFKDAKYRCTAPASLLLISPDEYANVLRSIRPSLNDWYFAGEKDGQTIYTLTKDLNTDAGGFLISDEMTFLGVGQVSGGGYTFSVTYWPESPGFQIHISDTTGEDLDVLLGYATKALQNFPYVPTVAELENSFQSNAVFADREYSMRKTLYGVTYEITQSVSGWNTEIWITADPEIILTPFLS